MYYNRNNKRDIYFLKPKTDIHRRRSGRHIKGKDGLIMRTNTIDLLQGCFDENWRNTANTRDRDSRNQQKKNEEKDTVHFTSDRQYDYFWEIFG